MEGFYLFVILALTLVVCALAEENYLYVSPWAFCDNTTINYTCDGSIESPFATIQDGLDAADDETIIVLTDGTYSGEGNINIELYDKYRRIESENGYSNTIIDCENEGFGIAIVKGTVLISGLTIENCNGITRELHNMTFGNGTLSASTSNYTLGGGLWIENSYTKITDCKLDSNVAELGGGLYGYSSSIELENTIVSNNEASYLGGGCFIYDGYLSLNHSTGVFDNKADNGGGGVYIRKATVELDYGSYLMDNEADNNQGNEVLCINGAGTMLHTAYISGLVIEESDFETGDAVCDENCALTREGVSFNYCNYSPPTTTDSASSNESESVDATGDSANSYNSTMEENSAVKLNSLTSINGCLSLLLVTWISFGLMIV